MKLNMKLIMERMRVPEVHWGAMLSKIPEGCKHRRIVSDYVAKIEENVKKPKGLLLFGEYGSGKSALCAICLKAAAAKGIIGLWVSARSIPDLQINKKQFDEFETIYERLLSVPILVLDELVIRHETAYSEHVAEIVIRSRVDSKLCTVINTNLAPSKIKEKYPALYDVLKECVLPVKITGINFRDGMIK